MCNLSAQQSSPNQALIDAVKSNNIEQTNQAISAGATGDYIAPDASSAWIYVKSRLGEDQVLKALIASTKNLASIRIRNENLAFLFMRQDIHFSYLDSVLAKGVDANAKLADGTSALKFSLQDDGRKYFSRTLIRHGAMVENLTSDEQVILATVLTPDEALLRSAIKQGLNINAINSKGETALMRYASGNELGECDERVKPLLASGANPAIKNPKGKTAAHIIRETYQESSKNSETFLPPFEKCMDLLPLPSVAGKAVGKVFQVSGSQVEINGQELKELRVGSKILIKTAKGEILGTITEILHTKAKAKISKKNLTQKGDKVYLTK